MERIQNYELLYLVSGNFTEEELEPIKTKVKDFITKSKGKITFEEGFGKKKLAYPIEKTNHGYYIMVEFEAETRDINEIDRELRLADDIMRHTIIKRIGQVRNVLKIDEEPREETNSPAPTVHKEREQKEEKAKEEDKEKDKVKLEDLDQKLDEILEGKIA
jgi:small subunit ribosomal protein S6